MFKNPLSFWRRATVTPLLLALIVAWPSARAQETSVPCKRFWRRVDCVAVPLADPAQDALAKQFLAPSATGAKIYITRVGTMDPKEKSDIFFDGKFVGSLAPMTYLVLETRPGQHSLTAQIGQKFTLSLNLSAGRNSYVEEQLSLLFNTTKRNFGIVDEKNGQAAVLKARLIEMPADPSP